MSLLALFRRLTPVPPPPSSAEPFSPAVMRIVHAYRAWAAENGLAVGFGGRLHIEGRVHGRHVAIDPGVPARVPSWVDVLVVASVREGANVVVTRMTATTDPLCAAMRAWFDHPILEPELRAIVVAPRMIRLRFAPGAPPEIVEVAMRCVAAALRNVFGAAP